MTSFFDFESLISFEEKIALHFFKKRESANYQCGQAISRFAIPTMQCTKFFIPLQYIFFYLQVCSVLVSAYFLVKTMIWINKN